MLRHPGRPVRGLPPALHRSRSSSICSNSAKPAACSRSRATSSSRSRPGRAPTRRLAGPGRQLARSVSASQSVKASRRPSSVGRPAIGPLDEHVEREQAVQRLAQLRHRPARAHPGELLGHVGAELGALHDRGRVLARRAAIRHVEELPDPRVELGDDQRLRRRLDEPVEHPDRERTAVRRGRRGTPRPSSGSPRRRAPGRRRRSPRRRRCGAGPASPARRRPAAPGCGGRCRRRRPARRPASPAPRPLRGRAGRPGPSPGGRSSRSSTRRRTRGTRRSRRRPCRIASISAVRVAPRPLDFDGIWSSSSTNTSALPGATAPSGLPDRIEARLRADQRQWVRDDRQRAAAEHRGGRDAFEDRGRRGVRCRWSAIVRGGRPSPRPRPPACRGHGCLLETVAVVAPEVAERSRHDRARAARSARPVHGRRRDVVGCDAGLPADVRLEVEGPLRDAPPGPRRPSPASPGSGWPTTRTGRASARGAGRPACRRRRRSAPRGSRRAASVSKAVPSTSRVTGWSATTGPSSGWPWLRQPGGRAVAVAQLRGPDRPPAGACPRHGAGPPSRRAAGRPRARGRPRAPRASRRPRRPRAHGAAPRAAGRGRGGGRRRPPARGPSSARWYRPAAARRRHGRSP